MSYRPHPFPDSWLQLYCSYQFQNLHHCHHRTPTKCYAVINSSQHQQRAMLFNWHQSLTFITDAAAVDLIVTFTAHLTIQQAIYSSPIFFPWLVNLQLPQSIGAFCPSPMYMYCRLWKHESFNLPVLFCHLNTPSSGVAHAITPGLFHLSSDGARPNFRARSGSCSLHGRLR